jgi:signal transduction histidine kinase
MYSINSRYFCPVYVMVAYFGIAQLSQLIVHPSTRTAPVWPPSAIGLAAALRLGRLPSAVGIFAGSVLHYAVMYLTSTHHHNTMFICLSPGFAAINSLEATLCCTVIFAFSRRRNGAAKWFDTGQSALKFFTALPFAPLVSGYLLALLSLWAKLIDLEHLGRIGLMIWLGRFGAMVALTPALLTSVPKLQNVTVLCLYIALGGVYSFVFFGGWGILPQSQVRLALFPAMGLLSLASTSIDIQAVSLAILITMGIVIWGTALERGPFAGHQHTPNFWMILEQSFICVVSIKILCITTLVQEMSAKNDEVNKLNALLETRVTFRTSESIAAMDRADETTTEKHHFIKRVCGDVRTPLVALKELCHGSEHRSPVLRAQIGSTVELILTVLDDLVDIGYAERGRMCSETIKFDPTALFRAAVTLAVPGLVDQTVWVIGEVPRYVDGDPKRLRRCLVAMIRGCHERGQVIGLQCRLDHKVFGRVHKQVFCFEIHADTVGCTVDLEEGSIGSIGSTGDVCWTPVEAEGDSAAEDRPAVLSDELGGTFYLANEGLSAKLEVPLRKALDVVSFTKTPPDIESVT